VAGMVEPHSIQDMGRESVHLMEKKLYADPATFGWRYTDLWILQSAICDERFRALIQWKIEEFQRCGS
jgi:hypothetical protein